MDYVVVYVEKWTCKVDWSAYEPDPNLKGIVASSILYVLIPDVYLRWKRCNLELAYEFCVPSQCETIVMGTASKFAVR